MTVKRAFAISILIHIAIMLFLRLMPEAWVWEAQTPEIAEIEFIERPPALHSQTPQIVRETTPPEKVNEPDSTEDARFLSENRKRVLVESQARDTGLTQNSASPRLPHDSWLRKYSQRNGNTSDKKQLDRSLDGYEPIPMPSPQQDTRTAFEGAPSTTGEMLPDDISLGEFTALNTDRFKFYSFYARIEELVRFRWEQGLRNAIDSIPQNQMLTLTRDRWTTQVEFWLTPEGRFHSAHIHRESGLRRFDGAAVNAFRDASVFPNPPIEMVERDGFIRIQYSFTVRWSPTSLANRPRL